MFETNITSAHLLFPALRLFYRLKWILDKRTFKVSGCCWFLTNTSLSLFAGSNLQVTGDSFCQVGFSMFVVSGWFLLQKVKLKDKKNRSSAKKVTLILVINTNIFIYFHNNQTFCPVVICLSKTICLHLLNVSVWSRTSLQLYSCVSVFYPGIPEEENLLKIILKRFCYEMKHVKTWSCSSVSYLLLFFVCGHVGLTVMHDCVSATIKEKNIIIKSVVHVDCLFSDCWTEM